MKRPRLIAILLVSGALAGCQSSPLTGTSGDTTPQKKDEKPTNEGEGVEGYLVDPTGVQIIAKSGGSARITAKAGWIVPDGTFQINVFAMPIAPESPKERVPLSLISIFEAKASEAFDQTVAGITARYLVLSVGKDTKAAPLHKPGGKVQAIYADLDAPGAPRVFSRGNLQKTRASEEKLGDDPGIPGGGGDGGTETPGDDPLYCVFSDNEFTVITNRPPQGNESCGPCDDRLFIEPDHPMYEPEDPRHPCEVLK